jgi:hypothetical protein
VHLTSQDVQCFTGRRILSELQTSCGVSSIELQPGSPGSLISVEPAVNFNEPRFDLEVGVYDPCLGTAPINCGTASWFSKCG